jgi:hypothetical protein
MIGLNPIYQRAIEVFFSIIVSRFKAWRNRK